MVESRGFAQELSPKRTIAELSDTQRSRPKESDRSQSPRAVCLLSLAFLFDDRYTPDGKLLLATKVGLMRDARNLAILIHADVLVADGIVVFR